MVIHDVMRHEVLCTNRDIAPRNLAGRLMAAAAAESSAAGEAVVA